MNKYFALLLIIISFSCQQAKTDKESNPEPQLFQLLGPEKSQVTFENKIVEGLNTNVLMYEYFYNGGGVATGDLNGDGKTDLYFSSNMENNHLYLNQGNLVFKEVAEKAGVTGRPGPWKTGVSLVDINGDQKLDIYLCYSGNLPPDKKRNQLFINQGNDAAGIPIFQDEAAGYGLDSPANSTHAVFFDYDKDQDLDMILVNHNPKSLPILDESSTADLLRKEDPNSGLRFFIHKQKGHFEDQTSSLGISSSTLSYGLAVGISDVNADGWLDFYVSNDYTIPDYLYINQQGKKFKNVIQKSMGHSSHFSMGNDIADVNNDGMPDVFTLDMLPEDNLRQKNLMAPDNYEKFNFNVAVGFGHQYMRNMLQLNQGIDPNTQEPRFQELGQMAGISNTDWSWSALFADYDNDGWKDLYITNGYLRDYTNLDFLKYMGDYVQNNQTSIQRQNVLELVQKMPASNISNYMFKNQQNGLFNQVTQAWGMENTSNSNGAAFADLDGDGDLEIIVNNINKPAFIFENKSNELKKEHKNLQIELQGTGLNTLGLGAKIWVYQQGKSQYVEQNLYRGYQSSVSPILHVGLGKTKADSLLIIWNSGKGQRLKNINSAKIILKESEAGPISKPSALNEKPIFVTKKALQTGNFQNQDFNDFKRQTQISIPLSQVGPIITKGDINGDKLEDIYVGNQGKGGSIYLQTSSGEFKLLSSGIPLEQGFLDNDARFFDADGDGDLDLWAVSGGYGLMEPNDPHLADRLYLNDGKGNFKKSSLPLPSQGVSKSCIQIIDINQDRLADVFVGGRVIPGRYPECPKSFVLLNQGGGKFKDVSAQFPAIQQAGMVTDAAWDDLNNDGKKELILVGEFMPIKIFNFQANSAQESTSQFFEHSPQGLWNKIRVEDLNRDGKKEILVGNLGLNSQWKASAEQPMELHFKDYDQNGSIDPILCTYVKGESFPFMTRDELLDQMSIMRTRFTDYQSFAEAKFSDIITDEEQKGEQIWTANELRTSLFQMNAQGKYESRDLPWEVQSAPISAIAIVDLDGKNDLDIVLAGNMIHAKLRIGRMDANSGLLLRSIGSLTYEALSPQKTGLWLQGDVRSLQIIGKQLLVGINQHGVFQFNMSSR
ncbi:VCBS repeat-containing protein [Aquirufa rosea]|uniref:RNA-binding protein n=1 Tax=Aquirufa rosea TaxID=2509241 RepID=A0A4Q1C014_9BACT|nr:VCBS repeat-containing protein [Aquirufa rosea]RXK49725.1 RNA-binding protein [Aquirufa rosea]